MMMLWAWAGVPLGVYNIAKDFNVALRIQPQILTFLSLVTWIQCFYYERVHLSHVQLRLHLADTDSTGRFSAPSQLLCL